MASESFAATLKQIRLAHHTSQSKLAEAADFDHSYLSRLESGQRMPTRDAVARIVTALALDATTADELYAAAGFMPDGLTALNLPAELVELANALGDLPPQLMSDALAAVRAITRGISPSFWEKAHRHEN